MHWRHKGSHLHNNDASLVSRSAHVLCWQCALALSLSVRGPGRASPAVWLAGFAPLAACLAMTHVAVFRLTPNAAGRPSVTSYAYGLLADLYEFSSIYFKSAAFSLQISENNLKPPQNPFKRQIKIWQWSTTRGSYVHKPMGKFKGIQKSIFFAIFWKY